MKEISVDDKLFEILIKAAAEEAMILSADELPSCEEANAQYKPSPQLDKKIRAIISRHDRKQKFLNWSRITAKIAAVLAIFIIISGVLLLSVEATRNIILNAVIKHQEDYFTIQFDNVASDAMTIFQPSYIPSGFKEDSTLFSKERNKIVFKNEAGVVITLTQYLAQKSNFLSDNEDKDFIKININQNEAYLVEADEQSKDNIILWEQDGFVFNLMSEVESAELILIAESIKNTMATG